MKIECPHCGQRIDLGGSNLSSFACPGCNAQITLQVTAAAGPGPPAQGELVHQVAQSPMQPQPPGQVTATNKAKAGFNLLVWLVAIFITGPILGKCAQDLVLRASGNDPDDFRRPPKSRQEADRELLERNNRIMKKFQERHEN
jgi:hypothetical protein